MGIGPSASFTTVKYPRISTKDLNTSKVFTHTAQKFSINGIDMKFDDKDKLILEELQRDSRQSLKRLAKKLRIPLSTLHSRINRIDKSGVIKYYGAVLDKDKVDKGMVSFTLISVHLRMPRPVKSKKTTPIEESLGKKIAEYANVQAVYSVTGDWDLLVKVVAGSVPETHNTINKIRTTQGVDKTHTFVCFDILKDTLHIDF